MRRFNTRLPKIRMTWSSLIPKNWFSVATVLGGFLIHLTLGNLYSFGNMMTYMDSYMHIRVSDRITYSNFIWVNAVTTSTQGLFMTFGGPLEKKIGIQLTCLLGCVLMSSGIALTYWSIMTSFAAVLLTYGFLSGLGIALAYVVPLSCGMRWFPERKGFVSGIIVGGFGLGALGSTTLQTYFLNPDNISVAPSGYFEDKHVLDRVPSVFLLMGGIFFLMQLVGCSILSRPPPEQKMKLELEAEGLLEEEEREENDKVSEDQPKNGHFEFMKPINRDKTVSEAIRSSVFYLLLAIYFLNSIAVGYINAMFKSFGQTFISSDFFLAKVGSFAALFNCGGRVFWGKLMDKTTFKFSMATMTLVLATLYLTFPLTTMLGKEFFAVWVWGIFFSFSGTFVLISTATEKAFGSTNYSSIYGLIFTNQIFASIALSLINELVLHRFGYSSCFIIISVLVSGSAALTLFLPKNL